MSESVVKITTPGGEISAHAIPEENYPSIRIEINGVLAAWVEFHVPDGVFKVYSYSKDYDDPQSTIIWEADKE